MRTPSSDAATDELDRDDSNLNRSSGARGHRMATLLILLLVPVGLAFVAFEYWTRTLKIATLRNNRDLRVAYGVRAILIIALGMAAFAGVFGASEGLKATVNSHSLDSEFTRFGGAVIFQAGVFARDLAARRRKSKR